MKDPRREYETGLTEFAQPHNRWAALEATPGKPTFVFWGKAAGMSAAEIIADAHASGVMNRDGLIRRAWDTAHPQGNRPQGDWRQDTPRAKPTPPKPSRAVEDCVEAGRRGLCTTSGALMSLSPVEVRHMDMAGQRRAQLAAMFDRPDLRALPVGIMPRSGSWNPRPRHDFMPVTEWLADGARLSAAGELVKINPFTGASEERRDGKPHLATVATVAAFPHVLMEFDEMPLADQCAFWYGALTIYRLPIVALVYSGGKSIHGVVRVDCVTRAEFDRAANLARRTFATSPNPSMRLDVQSLKLPIAGSRLAGCVRADTNRTQRLLYLAAPNTPTTRTERRTTPQERAVNRAPETYGARHGREIGVFAHVSTDRLLARDSDMFIPPPQEPDGNAPLDEILAYEEVLESMV